MTNITEDHINSDNDLMEELLTNNPPRKPLRRGEIIDGTIMEINEEGLLLNIGHKSEGIVPSREMRSYSKIDFETLESGSEVVALVINPEDDDGATILSVDKARGERGWRVLEKAKDDDIPVEGIIIGSNRGGAVVQAEDVQGFIPLSQLVGPARELFGPKKENAKDGFVGMKITFKIFELNRRRNRAIFSEKAVLQQERAAKKKELIETLKEGDILNGRIVGVSTFGAFVDIGGADGLIHISELSWDPVSSPADIVTVGTEMNVYVVKVDKENLKIALSLKRLTPEPWEIIKDELVNGKKIDATVTKITTFGAFVRTKVGVEGLLHVSEIAHEEINSVDQIERLLSVGQTLNLTIVNVDTERKRLGLSLISNGEPKAEEPVAEEPKSEEPIAEEPKSEEPVAEADMDYLSKRNVNEKIETFSSGDTVILNLLIKEGERERVQAFQGNVIKGKHITGQKVLPGKSFTVRRMASGVGVERTLPISSPSIDSLKVIRKGKVRQSKLYYLRDLTGKKARIKEAR